MNKVLFGFAAGLTVGSLVTLAIVDKKYRKIADEEIEAVREYYKNKHRIDSGLTVDQSKLFREVSDEDIKLDVELPKIPEEQYKKIVDDLGYNDEEMAELLNDPDISIEQNENGEVEIFLDSEKESTMPYVIAPEEFGEYDYDTKEWTYYSDFVLVDEEGEIVSEPESIIGDALSHFGEYEDGAVHVRNDGAECDYEIIKHNKTFSEVYGSEN